MKIQRCAVILVMAAVILGAASLGLILSAPRRGAARLTGEQIARVTHSQVLQPTRQIDFGPDTLRASACVSENRGLVYVICRQRPDSPAPDESQPRGEICVVDPRSGETVARVPFPGVSRIWLSPDERYLVGRSGWTHRQPNTLFRLYETSALAGPAMSFSVATYRGSVAVDDTGRVYLAHLMKRKLERFANGATDTVDLTLYPVTACFGPDDRVLYLSVTDPDLVDKGQIWVVDPSTLRTIQSVPLPGRSVPRVLQFWREGRSLLCVSDVGAIDQLPAAENGRLFRPRPLIDLSELGLAWLAVDEKRSLAYATGHDAELRFVVCVIDLRAKKVLGVVTVATELLEADPQPYVVPATDELWLRGISPNSTNAYDLDDLVIRARPAAN